MTSLNKEVVSVPEFYSGRSIFITGGTGFLGKVLVEKLLRSCPKIKNIYLLIRPKRGQEVAARLSKLLSSPLFNTVRREQPTDLSKVIPISGDTTLENLGISEDDQSLLCTTVSIVFHSAATVSFDEKLKLAVTINILGTKRLIELCRRMMLLEAFVHVSTIYCKWDQQEVTEVVSSTPYQPDDIISLINWLPEDKLEKLTPTLLGKHPNTYSFTKELSEQMLLQEAVNLPVAIIRPSIVGACFEEPESGWLDNFNGINGFLAALANGDLRTMICEPKYVADIIPVDIVINLMIAIAWQTATTRSSDLKVFNCVSSKKNPITCNELFKRAIKFTIQHPLETVFWYPTFTLYTNRQLHMLHFYLVQYTSAYLIDLFAGKNSIMLKTQQQLYRKIEAGTPFLIRQWNFNDDNVRGLLTQMSPKDSQNFQFDVTVIDWEKYCENFMLGIRKFLFKQNSNSLPSSRRRMLRLYYLHQASKILLILSTWRILWPRSKDRSKL